MFRVRGRDAEELMRAIRAKCLDCSGGSKSMVKGCRVPECPLWNYRTAEAQARRQRVKGQLFLTIGGMRNEPDSDDRESGCGS